MARKRAAELWPADVRDELLRHVDAALQALRSNNLSDEHIHQTRTQLKRARANLRLLRDTVGKSVYARENAALRDAAQPLSGVRDAKVLVETSDQLIEATHSRPRKTLLLKVRKALEKARREARAELRLLNAARHSATSLSAARTRIGKWKLAQSNGSTLDDGLKRVYARGRDAFATARDDSTPEKLHEWRKQVKYLEQAAQVWKSHDSRAAGALAKRAGKLADVLGSDHDLVVFDERLKTLDAPAPVRPDITRMIAARRRKLQREALKQGRVVFAGKPRSFVRKVAHSRGHANR